MKHIVLHRKNNARVKRKDVNGVWEHAVFVPCTFFLSGRTCFELLSFVSHIPRITAKLPPLGVLQTTSLNGGGPSTCTATCSWTPSKSPSNIQDRSPTRRCLEKHKKHTQTKAAFARGGCALPCPLLRPRDGAEQRGPAPASPAVASARTLPCAPTHTLSLSLSPRSLYLTLSLSLSF